LNLRLTGGKQDSQPKFIVGSASGGHTLRA
jgi:hypothetical protein